MNRLWWGVSLLLVVGACSRKAHTKESTATGGLFANDSALFAALFGAQGESSEQDTVFFPHRAKRYQGSYPIRWQLIHTDLSLSLDWAKKEIPGEAQLTLRPYFAPQQELVLDAKSFQIEEVRLLRPTTGRILSTRYDTLKLYLTLDRPYTSKDTVVVYIRYRAQPEKIGEGGSTAIGGRKGGYFINADGKRPCVPRQFWTQGEPESASAWFPTIEGPNQKTTQRLCVTVEDSLVSLSNGILVSQKKLPGGLRQDCWELRQPHAPYLFALVIGNFHVVKDTWRGREVTYYMEPAWKDQARAIFGRTPQMLEFFSNRLGVEFPWPKYGQVIVRDFVSGAMENTTAVIHGDMLFYDKAKALTENYESVVAHELFHHWFGDLVTCESWAQLPLNESFADYSEYLWIEHADGIELAEEHRRQAFFTYTAEAREKKVSLIRFDYGDPMAMFDAHSYQKGGLTLHYLRNIVGDSAFFLSLKQYLTDNAYKAADIDHLRHAFEKVTGEDWTWFFDQHFRRADEVRLLIKGESRGDTLLLEVKQRDYDTLRGPYRYRLAIAVLSESGYEELPFEYEKDTLIRLVRRGVRYADVDPKRLFIGRSKRDYPQQWWDAIVSEGKYLWQRLEGLSEIQPYLSADSEKLSRLLNAYQTGGVVWKKEIWEAFQLVPDSEAIAQVLPLARRALADPDARVRAAVWSFLVGAAQQEIVSLSSWRDAIQVALRDSSSDVQNYGLVALYQVDSTAALAEARQRLSSPSEDIFIVAALLLTQRGDSQAVSALVNRYSCLAGLSSRAQTIGLLAVAYQRAPSMRERLLPLMQRIAREENPWYLRLQMVQYMKFRLGSDPAIERFLKRLKEEETHPQLRSVYQRIL